ncbi:MAG: winged helix-turn-helix domain-containing protein [Chloroflexota bacterium]
MSTESRWMFLSNHGHVLICVLRNPEILLREVAQRVGVTERAAQRIVSDLERSGYVTRERIGRRNRYTVHAELPLRHPLHAHLTIGQLFEILKLEPPTHSGAAATSPAD